MDYKVHLKEDGKKEDRVFMVTLTSGPINCKLGCVDKCVRCGKKKLGEMMQEGPDYFGHVCYDCLNGKSQPLNNK
jgi:hypothetical protein